MLPSTPKPKHLAPEYGAQFSDGSVVAAYGFRPPYPSEVFNLISDLIDGKPRVVLDAGCGSGDLAIPLAHIVDRVDAVDQSTAMIEAAQLRPGADNPRLRWIVSSMEEAYVNPPYSLVTCGESLHWMDWPVVMARFREALVPNGCVAIVGRVEQANPWWPELLDIINSYSTNRDYQPYDLIDELEARGLFRRLGSKQTAPVPYEQSIDDYVESVHSRNGFSRDRMTGEAAMAFDHAARVLLERYAPGGIVRFDVMGSVVWGAPAP